MVIDEISDAIAARRKCEAVELRHLPAALQARARRPQPQDGRRGDDYPAQGAGFQGLAHHARAHEPTAIERARFGASVRHHYFVDKFAVCPKISVAPPRGSPPRRTMARRSDSMDKTQDAFRTIGEVAEALDLPQHVLRFWETKFTQIRPVKRAGGRRYYRPEDVAARRGDSRPALQRGLYDQGVQRILKEQGARAVIAASRANGRALPSAARRRSQSRPRPAANRALADLDATFRAPPPPGAIRRRATSRRKRRAGGGATRLSAQDRHRHGSHPGRTARADASSTRPGAADPALRRFFSPRRCQPRKPSL